jgi:RimJ/RimL family protein N-acetyltransferase
VLYTGPALIEGEVRLVAPDVEAVRRAQTDPDDWGRWLELARTDDSVVYFSVEARARLVGEIFIHDIVHDRFDGMLGYHVFDPAVRGRGIGTAALAALLDWIARETPLRHVFVITHEDNIPSRRLVERAGFAYVGRAQEDRNRVVYEYRSASVGF